jgi:hypothetical protein
MYFGVAAAHEFVSCGCRDVGIMTEHQGSSTAQEWIKSAFRETTSLVTKDLERTKKERAARVR